MFCGLVIRLTPMGGLMSFVVSLRGLGSCKCLRELLAFGVILFIKGGDILTSFCLEI